MNRYLPHPGDNVVYEKGGKTDWTVTRCVQISPGGDHLVFLQSGMTGRRTTALASQLTPSPRQNIATVTIKENTP